MRLQTAATNIVQTAASRSQDHWSPGTFPDASLNIIGCARLASLVGPVVFTRCWFDDIPVMKLQRELMISIRGSDVFWLGRVRQNRRLQDVALAVRSLPRHCNLLGRGIDHQSFPG